MHVDRGGTLPTTKAPEASFTGDVHISGYFERDAGAGRSRDVAMRCADVRCPKRPGAAEPGAEINVSHRRTQVG